MISNLKDDFYQTSNRNVYVYTHTTLKKSTKIILKNSSSRGFFNFLLFCESICCCNWWNNLFISPRVSCKRGREEGDERRRRRREGDRSERGVIFRFSTFQTLTHACLLIISVSFRKTLKRTNRIHKGSTKIEKGGVCVGEMEGAEDNCWHQLFWNGDWRHFKMAYHHLCIDENVKIQTGDCLLLHN